MSVYMCMCVHVMCMCICMCMCVCVCVCMCVCVLTVVQQDGNCIIMSGLACKMKRSKPLCKYSSNFTLMVEHMLTLTP